MRIRPVLGRTIIVALTLLIIFSSSISSFATGANDAPDVPTWEKGDSWKYENYYKGAEKTNYFYKNVTKEGEYVNGQVCYKVEMIQNHTNIANYYNKRGDLARVKVEHLFTKMGQDRDEVITFEPPFKRFEFPLTNGSEWSLETVRTSSEFGKRNISYEFQCFGQGNVTTQAGTFEAYLIGMSETYPDADFYHHMYTKIYYSPEVKNEVRRENYQVSQEGELGQPQSGLELVSYDITPPDTENKNEETDSSTPFIAPYIMIPVVASIAILVRYKDKR